MEIGRSGGEIGGEIGDTEIGEIGDTESAGINRSGVANERVVRAKV